MPERLVQLSVDLARDIWGGPPNASEFKRTLQEGYVWNWGKPYISKVTEGIPGDAVVAGPEPHLTALCWDYRVISEQWPDDGKTWFMPVATWVPNASSNT